MSVGTVPVVSVPKRFAAGPLYGFAEIEKYHASNKRSVIRVMVVSKVYLFQVNKRGILKRVAPLDDIITVQEDAQGRVLLKTEYGTRDWVFRFVPGKENTLNSPSALVELLNKLMPGRSPITFTKDGITEYVDDRRHSGQYNLASYQTIKMTPLPSGIILTAKMLDGTNF